MLRPTSRGLQKTVILAFLFVMPYLSSAGEAPPDIKVIHLSVGGMVSPTCPVLLKSAVKNIKGVKRVEASLEQHSATIEYDANETTPATLQRAIATKAGFVTSALD